MSSDKRNGKWGFVGEAVGHATLRSDLPALNIPHVHQGGDSSAQGRNVRLWVTVMTKGM